MSGVIILLLAAVFGFAAVSKMRARADFIAVLRKLLPSWLANPFSLLVPAVELFLTALLLSGFAPHTALIAAIVLLVVFTVVLLEMRRRGVEGCACFGESSHGANLLSGIVRNVLLFGAATASLYSSAPVSFIGPDLSSFLGRITVVIGIFCLWPCLVALPGVYKQFSQQSKV